MQNKPDISTSITQINQPRDLKVLSFVVTLLFNHVCGFFALYYTVSAKHNWKQNDLPKALRHAKYSTCLIVFGILLGLATYALSLSLYFTLRHGSDGENKIYSTFCCTAPLNEQQTTTLCQASDDNPIYFDPSHVYGPCCLQSPIEFSR